MARDVGDITVPLTAFVVTAQNPGTPAADARVGLSWMEMW